jgi:hypothetical protein
MNSTPPYLTFQSHLLVIHNSYIKHQAPSPQHHIPGPPPLQHIQVSAMLALAYQVTSAIWRLTGRLPSRLLQSTTHTKKDQTPSGILTHAPNLTHHSNFYVSPSLSISLSPHMYRIEALLNTNMLSSGTPCSRDHVRERERELRKEERVVPSRVKFREGPINGDHVRPEPLARPDSSSLSKSGNFHLLPTLMWTRRVYT